MIPGQGVKAVIAGKEVLAGNKRLISSEQISLSDDVAEKAQKYIKMGASIIYVAVDKTLSGIVALSDSLRAE